MPYTPAHAICALPLWHSSRKHLPLPALMVGCMAPDLPYLVHLAPVPAAGHTVLGLVTHAVPQGLLALSVWYLWLEKPLLALFALPPAKRQLSMGWFLSLILSLFLGATTHAFLDATSHDFGWFVRRVDWLSLAIGGLPMFKLIQYGGGLIGLVAMGGWYLKAQKITTFVQPRLVWVGAMSLTISTLVCVCLANWVHQSNDLRSLAVYSASGAMSGVVVGACLYATIVRIKASASSQVNDQTNLP